MRYLFLGLALLAVVPGRAQTPGNCALGIAERVIDANDVQASVFNTGALFFGNETTNGKGYLVPKSTRLAPLFAAGLWIGGQVNGEVRVAGARYTRFEYWPGPLQDGAVLPDASDCTPYDRIFVVSRDDIADYLKTGIATDDLRDWPVSWGAPVLDGDGVEGNYNLPGGDQPAIYGDQSAWWVMNDVGNVHEETKSNPLGVEVQVTAFGVESAFEALREATFYRYRIINRSTQAIDSAYVALWMDPDLGDAGDDYIGSDTTLSMGFVYNGDEFDDPSANGYGIPPAQGYMVAQGPVGLANSHDDDDDGSIDEFGERLGLTAASCWAKFGMETSDPRTASEYYNCMKGRWKSGDPMTAAGVGFQTEGEITPFAFPGNPVANECWSMANDCLGRWVSPGDQRLMVASGPFRLEPGAETVVVFALPFAQGRDYLESVALLRGAARGVQAAWDDGVLAPSFIDASSVPPNVPGPIELAHPTPNPFTDRLTLGYSLPDALALRITVLDLLGREVAVLAQGEQAAGPRTVEVDTSGWPSGHYLVRVQTGLQTETFVVLKTR